MKKTNEKGDILKLFKSKKFIENEYKGDLDLLIEKYNELGYRDARIVSDSIVPFEESMVDVYIEVDEGQKYYLKDINWVGNTVYPTEVLNRLLRMAPGDVYNQKLLRQRMTEDEDAISTLYMDNGYLFAVPPEIPRWAKAGCVPGQDITCGQLSSVTVTWSWSPSSGSSKTLAMTVTFPSNSRVKRIVSGLAKSASTMPNSFLLRHKDQIPYG